MMRHLSATSRQLRLVSPARALALTAALLASLILPCHTHADSENSGEPKRIVFFCHDSSHGRGAHEYAVGSRLMGHWLEQHYGDQVVTELHVGWPENSDEILGRADAVVVFCTGGGGHLLRRHLNGFDQLMRKGVGLVCLHYAVEIPAGNEGDMLKSWLGGYFETHWSVNPHWVAKFEEFPDHPTANGLVPFEINDEWYFHMRFVDDLKGVVPVLTTPAPESTMKRPDGPHSGNPHVRESVARSDSQHLAWAYERGEEHNHGRAYGFTGLHYHWNFEDDNFRKALLNGIAWTAGLEVPEAGVPSPTPTRAQLERSLDGSWLGEDEPETASAPAPAESGDPLSVSEMLTSSTQATAAAPAAAVSDSRDPQHAVEQLDAADGLKATLFASEPMMLSASAIDVDHRGRVWVCEIVNYRRRAGERPEGDRILILEDTTGDGIADKKTVFYQAEDFISPHGICVLGKRVLVSVGDQIIELFDDNGDDRADRREVLFANTGSVQHDHGIHSVSFGPDGRLYFNFGDHGKHLGDAKGEIITDLAGNAVRNDGKPYRKGMVFRSQLDGSGLETLGWNFRNNWEVAVDSFGSLWQSDNDDDGNKAVRINFVMEFGNYGYTDEMTGAGWRIERVTMEDEIFLRHWHQNDPGVVPNTINTGSGSPTGILVYEGDLLPGPYQNQLIHAEPGHNVVRLYPIESAGAGYTGSIEAVLTGTRDRWFRPSGVRTAPDGSLVIADWYDPGVGGHAMGDIERGRMFIVAPEGHTYKTPEFDFESLAGAIDALRNPNNSVRYLAWTAIHAHGGAAEQALAAIWNDADENPRFRARVLWLLGQIEDRGAHWVDVGLKDENPDLRITALRLARQQGLDIMSRVEQVLGDADPAVRREAAVALRFEGGPQADKLWAQLAKQHDGVDRWYLEALGIGADLHWAGRWEALSQLKDGDKPDDAAQLDLLWRSRTPDGAGRIAAAAIAHEEQGIRMLRALQFQPDHEAATKALLTVAEKAAPRVAVQAALLVKAESIKDTPAAGRFTELAQAVAGQPELVRLASHHGVAGQEQALLQFALANPEHQESVNAIRLLLGDLEQLQPALGHDEHRSHMINLLGRTGDGRATTQLADLMNDSSLTDESRRQAVSALGLNRAGEEHLLAMAGDGNIPEGYTVTVAGLLQRSRHKDIREAAAKVLKVEAPGMESLPPVTELLAIRGHAANGRAAFEKSTCASCHVVKDEGINFGPDLTRIGGKLPREAMLEAIIYPNAGISHGYQGKIVKLSGGDQFVGFISSETEHEMILRMPGGIDQTIATDKVESITDLEASLMPPGLLALLSPQEVADMLAYLDALK